MSSRFFAFIFSLLLFGVSLEGNIRDTLEQKPVRKAAASSISSYNMDLAVVAIFRDEARFLKEWVCFHQLMGVSKFYLYNNLSSDNYSEILAPFVESGLVELMEWRKESKDLGDWNSIQMKAYKDGMRRARRDKVKWLAVIDVDEFLVPRHHNNMVELLDDYPEAGGVTVNWVFFGTSHIDEIPSHQLMIEVLTKNSGFKKQGVKSILHTSRAHLNGPHFGECFEGFKEEKIPFEKAQLNHYWSRDKKFFYEVKVPRRIKLHQSVEVSEAWVAGWNRDNPESALPILRFIDELKILMNR